MNLQAKINEILNLAKFSNLSSSQKEVIRDCILANYLILSPHNQEKYLDIIKNNLIEIEDLGDNDFYKNGICYGGIVETYISDHKISANVIPYTFKLKYKLYPHPMKRLTRSVLHEFGHLAVKKQFLNLNDSKTNENGEVLIDFGGLVISESLKKSYGYGFSEVLNEFTTFLSFKSFLSYRPSNEIAQAKMREFAQKKGLSIEEKKDYLDVLPDDLFTSYTETYLANELQPEKTKEMFNPLYVKFTPLVRLIMRAFQNPTCTYQDLVNAFKSGEGLSATKNNEPINDLFYGYYESSFHTENLFNSIMKDQTSWKQFCLDFDTQLTLQTINKEFITTSIDTITKFYERRIKAALNNGSLTVDAANDQLEDFYQVSECCMNFYEEQQKTIK